MMTAALTLIRPSSIAVTGTGSAGSIVKNGKVVFTSAETISVNGVYSAAYDNYLIVIRHTSDQDITMLMRQRASGTDATGSNYTSQRIAAYGTTAVAARFTGESYHQIGLSYLNAHQGHHIYVYGPNLAAPTAVRSVSVYAWLGGSIFDYASTHSLSTSYDGFTLYSNTAGGDFTGALTVYGLAQ